MPPQALARAVRPAGRPDLAIKHATQALDSASGDYARSDFFAAMVLADAHLDRGDLDEGCRIAERAISVGEGLDSVRCRGYVTEFRQRLARHRTTEQARDLVAQVATSRLWATAASGQ
jgi:hypothetical protein